MLKIITLGLGIVLSIQVMAQSNLQGIVRDAKSNQFLIGATVQMEDLNHLTITDEQGRFNLTNVPAGKQKIHIRFVGFKEFSKEIETPTTALVECLLEEANELTEEVVVYATRVSEKTPMTFTTLNNLTIQKQNFGQDFPFILNWSPSIVTTSDAGTGIGYTGLRIRGSDATRINVTINGIPLNDSEEHSVYWVDIPDIAAATQSVQIQQGVGSSTNGAGAFGASINLQTTTRNDEPYAVITNTVGSFGTHKHTIGLGTGLKNGFVWDARMGLLKSDGYIDRASSDLKSYYLTGGYYGKKTFIKAITFGGRETTYQSWYGVPESRLNNDVAAMYETAIAEQWNTEQTNNLLNSNTRTFNAYIYPNQIDHYGQDHYQLHVSHRVRESLTAHVSLHYTYGKGYYEELKYNASFKKYGIRSLVLGSTNIESSDLVRRRWLQNHFYGATYSLNYEYGKINSTLGGALNKYIGDHFGEIIWAQYSTIQKDYRYYFNTGHKTDFTVFWKTNYQFHPNLNGFLDLQYRTIQYNASGTENDLQNIDINPNYHFFNPKIGATYSLPKSQSIYVSQSVAHREPVRSDFISRINISTPSPETLLDTELGWRLQQPNFSLRVNGYFMYYLNQLITTGQLNDVGIAIRTNVSTSYRTGIEIDGSVYLSKLFSWTANLTVSQNKIPSFDEVLYDYGAHFDDYKPVIRSYTNTDISFSPAVIAGSIFLYKPRTNVEIGLLTKFVGKQYLDNTSNEKRKLDSYLINDIRISYHIKPSFMKELSIGLLVNNVLDQLYASNGYTYGYLYGTPEVRQNYYYPQAGRNFLLMLNLRL